MTKAVFFKEWLKVRICYLCAVAVVLAFTIYALMRISRIITLKGVGHVWELMIGRDMIFMDIMQYVFPVAGIALAAAQFAPEKLQKRMKLTLHLPVSQIRMTFTMLGVGAGILLALFASSAVVSGIYLSGIVPPELTGRILLTMTPWYLAGLAAYFLVAWIITEPTLYMRIIAALITVAVLRMFYLSADPESYNCALPMLAWATLSFAGFSWLSVLRFKAGAQD